MTRIPPSKHLSQMVSELSSRTDAEDLAGQLARLGARKLIQELLEAEVSETLGRTESCRGSGVAWLTSGCSGRSRPAAQCGRQPWRR